MAVNLTAPKSLLPVAGVQLASVAAGIKNPNKPRTDLVLMRFAPGSQVAGVFTRNAFCAAPVRYCQQQLSANHPIRGFLINSGNANAGTGKAGEMAAEQTATAAAQLISADGAVVLPFSTGVIGVQLPAQRIKESLPSAVQQLDEAGWIAASQAIMTTDTVAKGLSRQVQTEAGCVTVTGIAKGAGMIRPDMATMLAFIACDANIERTTLQALLSRVVDRTFNAVTVDGDTSTNDAAMLVATGQVGDQALCEGNADLDKIESAIHEVCLYLAQALVRDGEGATRLIELDVAGARHVEEARQVAYTVAHSPLVKTACFAGDANWGRILAAVGRSGLPDLDVSRIDIAVDEVELIQAGEPHPQYSEARGAAVFARSEFTIKIGLGRGDAASKVWTCDLGHEYVRINAEYRT